MGAKNNREALKKEFFALLKRIRKDPQGGLKEFYEKYGKLIKYTARLFCNTDFGADEVVNDVLIKIWKSSDRFGDIENPEGWLYVITSNCAKSSLRKRSYIPLKETIADEKDGIQEFIDTDSFYFMIRELSEIEQQIIIHRCVSRYTFEEIGEILDKSTSTISSTFYRSIDKIKEKLGKFSKNA